MKHGLHFLVLLAGTALFFFSVLASAQQSSPGSESKESSSQDDAPVTMAVTVKGTNYCVGCTLKKHGANAQCSVAGHVHALKVEEARDTNGKLLENLKGWTLHYLSNKKGMELRDGRHGEYVTVTGDVYVQARVLDVATVSPKASSSNTEDS